MFSYPIGDLPKSKVRAFEFIKVLVRLLHLLLLLLLLSLLSGLLFVYLAAVGGFRAGFCFVWQAL